MQKNVQFYVDIWIKAKHRVTPGVLFIFEIFIQKQQNLSAEQIHLIIKESKKHTNVNISTIYRILEKMKTLELLHETTTGHYFLCTKPDYQKEAHHIAICEVCQKGHEIFLDYENSMGDYLSREKKLLTNSDSHRFLWTMQKLYQNLIFFGKRRFKP